MHLLNARAVESMCLRSLACERYTTAAVSRQRESIIGEREVKVPQRHAYWPSELWEDLPFKSSE